MRSLSEAKKFIIARGFSAAYFWGAISIPYIVFRGFPISEAFTLLAIYSFLVVVFEFPTGVIGDVYGHKFSVNLANAMGALNMFILAQNLPHWGYYILIVLAALSASLVSGSDDALLKKISNNFPKDLSTTKAVQAFVSFISIAIAGFIAKISITLPIYLTSFCWIIATILTSYVQDARGAKQQGNVFSQAFKSTRVVITNLTLVGIIIYASINTGFAINIKTLINSSAPALGLDLGYIGLLVGFGLLARSIAYQFSPKLEWITNKQLFGIAAGLFISLIAITPGYFSLFILGVLNGVTALIGYRADILINNLIKDEVRASVLSLKNLFARLFSSSYLLLAGYIIDKSLFQLLMFATLVLYAVAGISFISLKTKHAKQKAQIIS